jgi:hypothetical protein
MGRIDPERAAGFVRALRALKWNDLAPESAPPVERTPRFSIRVTGKNGTLLDEMRGEPRADGVHWSVTSTSSGGPWLVEGARLDEIAAQFAALRVR